MELKRFLFKKSVAIPVAITVVIVLAYVAGSLYNNFRLQPHVTPELGETPRLPAPKLSGTGSSKQSLQGGGGGVYSVNILLYRRMISYSSRIVLEVEDIGSSLRDIRNIASRHGGYISSLVYNMGGSLGSAYIVLKVPTENYRVALNELSDLGKVVEIREEANDVTMQYIDLEARLRNLRAEEARLLELLNKAQRVEEILKIEELIMRVRGEIERLSSQLMYLKNRVEYSEISVKLIKPRVIEPKPSPWPEFNIEKILADALRIAYTIIAGLIILTVGFTPLLIIAVIAWLLFRYVKKPRDESRP